MSHLRRWLGHPWIVLACQLVVALVFLAAAIAKIGDAGSFAKQIHYFRLVPAGGESLLAMTLPWIELLAALAILLRVQPRAGSVVIAGWMVVFVVAVGAALARGLDIECGCFGTADASRVGAAKLLENLGLLALALIGCLRPNGVAERAEAPSTALAAGAEQAS